MSRNRSMLPSFYLQEDGRQFAGGCIRYATFPLKAVTPSELVLEDNILKRQTKYRRDEKQGAW